jgi:predicted transposase/invertase (TIGR01784 family)
LELLKLPKHPDGTSLWAWLKFINAINEEDLEMASNLNPVISKTKAKLLELSADQQTRMLAELREKELRDVRGMIAKGREEGIEEGRIELAKKLLQDGYPIERLEQLTGLKRTMFEN